MPIHDWTRVDPAVFYHFHLHWVSTIVDALNRRILPHAYYVLIEQQVVWNDPDILTTDPAVDITAETDRAFSRRKQNILAVRHVSGDDLVAVIQIVSKGNKSSRNTLEDFVRKAAEFLRYRVHVMVIDLQPPTPRDPQGIHGAIWEEVAGEKYVRPEDKPLTLVAYESGPSVCAFVEPVAVRDTLMDMPLFLEPGRHVTLPLEETYEAAFASVPRHWRTVLEQE